MNGARPTYRNALLDALNEADFNDLQPFLISRELRRDDLLHAEGEIAEDVYFPSGAILSVIAQMEDGRAVECCSIGRESAYGLAFPFGAKTAVNRVIVQMPGRCYLAPVQRVRAAAARSPSLLEAMTRHLQGAGAQTEQSVACNALHDVGARLSRWILTSADRTDESPLPLTQEAMAFMLGVQRTTVTTAARALHSAGLISYRRGEITLLDRNALEDTACECYAAFRQKFRQVVKGR